MKTLGEMSKEEFSRMIEKTVQTHISESTYTIHPTCFYFDGKMYGRGFEQIPETVQELLGIKIEGK